MQKLKQTKGLSYQPLASLAGSVSLECTQSSLN